MSSSGIKNQILEAIKNRGVFYKYNGHELITKCPFCGDNNRPDDGHLYIQLNMDNDSPVLYHCFKCNEGGLFTKRTLEELGIADDELGQILNNNNKKCSLSPYRKNDIKNYYWEIPKPSKSDLNKIVYINKRLGIQMTKDMYDDMKVISNLSKFLKINDLNPTCSMDMLNEVSDHYVGFMTARGTHIWFRNLYDSQNIRWYKYPVLQSYDKSKNYYSIRNSVDVLSDDDITINLSEGVFDCLSIAYNLDNLDAINIAVGSTDYVPAINHLITLGLVGDNIHLNIYSDNDGNSSTSIHTYKKVLNKYKSIFGSIDVFYNTLSKDCGVPRKDIRLKQIVIY